MQEIFNFCILAYNFAQSEWSDDLRKTCPGFSVKENSNFFQHAMRQKSFAGRATTQFFTWQCKQVLFYANEL